MQMPFGVRLSRSRGLRARSRAIQRVGGEGLLLALGLVNQMSGWARVNRKVLDPPACQGQGGRAQAARMVSRGSCTEAEGDRPEGAPNALNFKADASWQVHRPADGVDRSGHGAKDFQESLGRAVPAPV